MTVMIHLSRLLQEMTLIPDANLFNDPDECGDAVSSDIAEWIDSKKPAKENFAVA